MITINSKWSANTNKIFVVTKTETIDENEWVFYKDNEREYSCYTEAFLARFNQLPE